MAYEQDGLIEANDFNNVLRNPVQMLYGSGYADRGYGQSAISIPSVAGPDTAGELQKIVASDEWTKLRNVMNTEHNHQGTPVTIPAVLDIAVDKLITYYQGNVQAVADLDKNRLLTASDAMTLYANRTSPNDTYTGNWNTQLAHEFKVVFASVDDARYFFNSGGGVRFTSSRSGGTVTTHNQFWTDLCSYYGPVTVGAHSTLSAFHRTLGVTGVGAGVGYYELPLWSGAWNSANLLWKGIGDNSTYSFASFVGSGNNITIYGATEDGMTGTMGDRGKTLRFRIEYNDLYTHHDFEGNVDEVIDGTMVANIGLNKATTYLTITNPTAYTNITALGGT